MPEEKVQDIPANIRRRLEDIEAQLRRITGSDLEMRGHRITGLSRAVNNSDATSLSQVRGLIRAAEERVTMAINAVRKRA